MNRDAELHLLLSKLRNVSPREEQVDKWLGAVQRELGTLPVRRRPSFIRVAQLAAVLATGFLLGALSSKHFEEKNEPVATVQYHYSKSE